MDKDYARFLTHIKDYSSFDMCWIWKRTTINGYGLFSYKGKQYYAHRWMYMQYREINPGWVVDHICRNRACVNPEHLEQVTPSDNIKRARQTDVCPKGHPKIAENTYVGSNGRKSCRICVYKSNRDKYAQRKAKRLSEPTEERTYCTRGHELTAENTYLYSKGTQRMCRICMSMRQNGQINAVDQDYCIRGHQYTEENTYITPSTGYRVCRTCKRRNS